MTQLRDILTYIFMKYPNPLELSKARLVKMIYLADWKSAIDNQKQLTDIKWFFNHYGPYVSEIIEEIREDKRFKVEWQSNAYGEPKELIMLIKPISSIKIDSETKRILDFVIEKTYPLLWSEFIDLVYSTFPIKKSPRYTYLDLVSNAMEYKNSTSHHSSV